MFVIFWVVSLCWILNGANTMWFFAADSVVLDLNQAVPSLCHWKNSSAENKNVVICQPCCFSHILCIFEKHKQFSRMSKLLFSKQRFIYCRVYCSFALPHVPCWLVFVGLTVSIPIHFLCTDKSTLEIMLTFFVFCRRKSLMGLEKHDNMRTLISGWTIPSRHVC